MSVPSPLSNAPYLLCLFSDGPCDLDAKLACTLAAKCLGKSLSEVENFFSFQTADDAATAKPSQKSARCNGISWCRRCGRPMLQWQPLGRTTGRRLLGLKQESQRRPMTTTNVCLPAHRSSAFRIPASDVSAARPCFDRVCDRRDCPRVIHQRFFAETSRTETRAYASSASARLRNRNHSVSSANQNVGRYCRQARCTTRAHAESWTDQ